MTNTSSACGTALIKLPIIICCHTTNESGCTIKLSTITTIRSRSPQKKHEKKTSYAVLHSPKYAGTISVIMQFFRPVSRMGCRAYGSWPEARITNLLRSSTSLQKPIYFKCSPSKIKGYRLQSPIILSAFTTISRRAAL